MLKGGEIMDQLEITIIGAILNGIALAIGMLIGTRVTGDVIEKKIIKIIDESPTAKSLKKTLKQVNKLLGNKALVIRATTFFEEATTLVSSKEAKNFFANVTELMKQLGTEKTEEVKLDLPTLPGAADDKEE